MLRHLAPYFVLLTLLAGAVLPVRHGVRAQDAQPLLVVVGNSTKLTDVSLALLRRTFQGEPATAGDGTRLVPFNHELGTPERTVFDRVVLGLEPNEVGRFWIDRRIRDQGAPPRTLPTLDLAPRVAASYPGAITYVPANMVTSKVRVLRVDGKLPTDPGYLFAGRR